MNPNEPEAINDLNQPRKPQHTSKPIIVGHRPMVADPMVKGPGMLPQNNIKIEPPPAQATPDFEEAGEAPQPQPETSSYYPPGPPLPQVPSGTGPQAHPAPHEQPPAPQPPAQPAPIQPKHEMPVNIPTRKNGSMLKVVLETAIIAALVAAAFLAGRSL